VPSDREPLPCLVCSPPRHQGLGGTHAFKVAQQLTQRRALIATATQRPERMLLGIARTEAVDAQQGGTKQRLPATQKRRRTVLQQRKVIARLRLLLGMYRRRELRHHRGKGLRLVEPMGKHRHTDA
jgi:hypothetical protein